MILIKHKPHKGTIMNNYRYKIKLQLPNREYLIMPVH